MKQKNTLGLIMALLILFSIGCGQTPDEHITKPDDVTLYQINLIRSLLIKSALRGTGTSRYKWG